MNRINVTSEEAMSLTARANLVSFENILTELEADILRIER